MNEEWRDVPGWEGIYRVSSEGRVESVERLVCALKDKACRLMPSRVMVQHAHVQGYLVVWFRRPGGVHKKYFVHRLVAIAFLKNPQAVEIVNHKDGNRTHNRVENLEWVTQSENVVHGYARKQLEQADSDF